MVHPDQFDYHLPEELIAKSPLEDRAAARMLVYKNHQIKHQIFRDIINEIPENALVVFNDTKVISARLIFQKSTGAHIEVFLLEPVSPYEDITQAMQVRGSAIWKCMIGNAKRWKGEQSLQMMLPDKQVISVKRTEHPDQVALSWPESMTLASLLEQIGKVPLPPYLHREADPRDSSEYQTVYSRAEGAVAAPTAGLHFTPDLIDRLAVNHPLGFVTLHVGAGTFMPITTTPDKHPMHGEQIIISKNLIQKLRNATHITAVGTTSMRTLESLYWYGIRLLKGIDHFFIPKMLPYIHSELTISKEESLDKILQYMESKGLEELKGKTEIFIFPGYEFRMVDSLITNFHLPGTTLMMLIAAFVGDDWKRIYQDALEKKYRFLSYGDASFLMKSSMTKMST